MSLPRIATCLLIILPICLGAPAGDLGERAFKLDDGHRKLFGEVASPGTNVAEWGHGRLIRLEGPETSLDSYTVFETTGASSRTSLRIPAAGRISLSHATVDPNGFVVLSGYAVTSSDPAEYFIARTEVDGTLVEYIRTGSFAPMAVCAGGDGTYWAFGGDLERHARGEDYPHLMRFTATQGSIGEYLPRSEFTHTASPMRLVSRWAVGPPNATWLRCTDAAAYVYIDQTDELFRFGTADDTVERWETKLAEFDSGFDLVGFAVTAFDDVYASIRSTPRGSAHIYALQRLEGSATWLPVRVDAYEASADLRLWGTDGSSLVVQDSIVGRRMSLSWLTPLAGD